MKARIIFHGAAILVLVATVAAAQAPKKPAKPAPAGQTSNREASAPSVSEREVSTGMSTGRRQHEPVLAAAAPQNPNAKPSDRESSSPSVSEVTMGKSQTSDRKSGSIIILENDGSEVHTAREASSGMATGRRQHEPVLSATDKSLGSAHAVESVDASAPADNEGGQMQDASSNPMYKGNQTAGTNPLYESKGKQAAPASGASHDVVQYKDGEDMTTRYRPGNNKTSKIKPTTGTTSPSH